MKVNFLQPAPVQAVNFGDVLKVTRENGEVRAYLVAVAPCTQKGKAVLVNLNTGDIRGRGKRFICNVQNYAFDIKTTDLETLESYAKGKVEIIEDAEISIG